MVVSLLLTAGLLAGSPQAVAKNRRTTAARPKPVRKIDRAHVVGAPVLDEKARPGVYVWLEDGRFQFAVVGGRTATQFQVRSSRPMRAGAGDGLVWSKRAARHYLGRSRSGRGAIVTRGHIKIGRARREGRRVRIYVGPLAQRAAKTVEIGAFGAVMR